MSGGTIRGMIQFTSEHRTDELNELILSILSILILRDVIILYDWALST